MPLTSPLPPYESRRHAAGGTRRGFVTAALGAAAAREAFSAAPAAAPVFFHPYCHLEELTNIEEGHRNIRRIFELCDKYGIKFEANFHRYMADDIRERSP